MPLRNRLDEVIRRYDEAASLVKRFKGGDVSEEELSANFDRLRLERQAVHDNNMAFFVEHRRAQWGEVAAAKYENDEFDNDEDESEDRDGSDGADDTHDTEKDLAEEVDGRDESGQRMGEYEMEIGDDDMESEEESVEEDDVEMDCEDGSALAHEIPRTKSEKRLWKEYGDFW